jgi:chaperonin GroES
MKVRPLSDRVLVKRVEEEEQVKGGIIIPDTAKETPQQAEVIAVGPGRQNDNGDLIAPEVEPGLQVLVGKYAGTEIEIEGEEYVILSEDDILGILE